MSLIITKNFKRAKAQDAAELRVGQRVRAKDPRWPGYQGRALGNGVYTVKKVDWDGTVKLDGFLDVWISPSSLVEANDACGKGEDAQDAQGDEVIAQKNGYKLVHNTLNDGYWFYTKSGAGWGITATNKVAAINEFNRLVGSAKDAAELNNDADLRAALSKMADIAKRLTDAKVSFKAGWTPDGIGEIILEFPNIESARKYNYYKLFNAWEAARSQIVPRWAVNIGGYRVPRIEGNRMTISILHFST